VDLIIGSNSRVAQRYVANRTEREFVAAGRDEISRWIEDGEGSLRGYLESLRELPEVVHLFAGVTDPRASRDEIWAVNVELPLAVLSVATEFGLTINTYGTVLEDLGPSENSYIESKRVLASEVVKARAAGVDATHVRFHTVYGASTPQSHMFLGQMLTALVSGDDFHMSSGRQFREYHHVDDVVQAIGVVTSDRSSASVTISHGDPIQLAILAHSIFASFDRLDSLKIGALADLVSDVTTPLAGRTPELVDLEFRDTIPAVVAYMHDAVSIRRASEE
jgi:nucleoside-diphosphate-sugar epimerase